ncbi:hypothetical protein KAR91_01945 [Candidatus Pacearchaeota archaeon]|nr:hypothetical protein [Candidatus Pacearchaeota archaeon]
MSPEKMIIDPVAAPFLMGMVVKIKDFAAIKGIAIAVTFIITTSSGMTVFYTQTSAMIHENKAFRQEVTHELISIKREIASVKQSVAITNNNVGHIRSDIDKLTAQVSEMISFKAKIRR